MPEKRSPEDLNRELNKQYFFAWSSWTMWDYPRAKTVHQIVGGRPVGTDGSNDYDGLAVGFGDTGSVGIGGITLGGGVGFLARKFGLGADRTILRIEPVLARFAAALGLDVTVGGVLRAEHAKALASAMAEDGPRCIEAGMDDYLSKPIAITALAAMMAKWVKPPIAAS